MPHCGEPFVAIRKSRSWSRLQGRRIESINQGLTRGIRVYLFFPGTILVAGSPQSTAVCQKKTAGDTFARCSVADPETGQLGLYRCVEQELLGFDKLHRSYGSERLG